MFSRALQSLRVFSSTFDITVSFVRGLDDFFGFHWIYTQLKPALKLEMVSLPYTIWQTDHFEL